MKLLITAFALFLTVCSFGQANLYVKTDEIGQVNAMENLLRALSYSNSLEVKEADFEGVAYLDTNFIDGVVVLTTGAKYSDIPLRYNVFNDLIEFKNPKGEVFNINNPTSINELIIGSSKFIYVNFIHSSKEKHLFAEVLSEGKASLLKHHRLSLQPAKQAETHRAAQPPKFVKIPSEYLIKKEGGNVQLIKSKKELLLMLTDKSKEINDMIAREKLSVKVESDLKQIVDFYNQN